MRDTIPKQIGENECGIMNLDSNINTGTHWVCYFKSQNIRYYFDSFGLPPPVEILKYVGRPLTASTFRLQMLGEVICGHYCVYVLLELAKGVDFRNIIFSLL